MKVRTLGFYNALEEMDFCPKKGQKTNTRARCCIFEMQRRDERFEIRFERA